MLSSADIPYTVLIIMGKIYFMNKASSTKLSLQNIGFWLLLALTVSIITRNVHFAGDERIIREPDVTLSDFIYYLGESLTRMFIMLSAYVSGRLFVKLIPHEPVVGGVKIIIDTMLILAVGKVFDEVSANPCEYSMWEKCFHAGLSILTIYKIIKWNRINKNRLTA